MKELEFTERLFLMINITRNKYTESIDIFEDLETIEKFVSDHMVNSGTVGKMSKSGE